MKRQRMVKRFLPIVFAVLFLGSCANNKSFNKRKFLPGRHKSLSHKIQVSNEVNNVDETYTDNKDSTSQELPKVSFEEQEVVQNKALEKKDTKSSKAVRLVNKRKAEIFIAQARISAKRTDSRLGNGNNLQEPESTFWRRFDPRIIASLLYLAGFAAIGTALILLFSAIPEIIIILVGGIGLILIYCGWLYWQKHGKPVQRVSTTETEAPTQAKSSENSISSKTLVTIFVTLFGVGAIIYYLFIL